MSKTPKKVLIASSAANIPKRHLRALLTFLSFFFGLFSAVYAAAQAGPYQNTASTPLNEIVAPCAGTHLIRTINVPDSFLIADVDLGLLITHTYRGDLQITLTSPSSTTVQIVTNNGSNGLDNYNIIADDAVGNDINVFPHNTADGTTAPPYENPVRPLGTMSDFNMENAQGDWEIDMCDFYNLDQGDYERADLFFTEFNPLDADLSLGITASSTTPPTGTNITLSYTVDNAGPASADGVSVDISLPSGLTYVSDNGSGAYNSGTGLWTIPGSISASGSATLEITAFVSLSGTYTTTAEVAASGDPDPDSAPGNAVTSEDDYDTLTISPVTPPYPSLLCPGAASVLDWDIVTWGTGSTSNSYTVDGETIAMTVTAPPGVLQNNAAFGGQSPVEQTTFTGGYSPVQSTVGVVVDQVARADTIDIDFDLGTFGAGVSKLQLTLFDVDFGSGQFQDQLTVTASLGGVGVTPVLVTSSANGAVSNVVTGNAAANSNVGTGNLTIEINSPIDTLEIDYGNGPLAPPAPGLQGMAIHDVFFCPPSDAVLTAEKTIEVYDPLGLGLYAVPGNDVIYTIEFTNEGTGPADSDSVIIYDRLPDEVQYYNADIDDLAGPETDPVIGIDNGSSLSLTFATDVRFSKSTTKPTDFVLGCPFVGTDLASGYDDTVKYICFNPKGAMAAGVSNPSFEVKFRAGIK